MVRPTKLFLREAKHVLWYLRGTTQFGIWYKQIEGEKICGFIDVDWVGSPLGWNSKLCGIFNVGFATIS